MDQPMLLLLALAVAVAVAALLVARMRTRTPAATSGESMLATSTEGMKICPKCMMGNLWTERSCSACGASLKG